MHNSIYSLILVNKQPVGVVIFTENGPLADVRELEYRTGVAVRAMVSRLSEARCSSVEEIRAFAARQANAVRLGEPMAVRVETSDSKVLERLLDKYVPE